MSKLNPATHADPKTVAFDLDRALNFAKEPEKEDQLTTSTRGAPCYLRDNIRKLAKRHGFSQWFIHYVMIDKAKDWLLASEEWKKWTEVADEMDDLEPGVNIDQDDLDRVRFNVRLCEFQEVPDAHAGRLGKKNMRVTESLIAQLGRIADLAEIPVNVVIQVLTCWAMSEQQGMDHGPTMAEVRRDFLRILDRRTRAVQALLDLWKYDPVGAVGGSQD